MKVSEIIEAQLEESEAQKISKLANWIDGQLADGKLSPAVTNMAVIVGLLRKRLVGDIRGKVDGSTFGRLNSAMKEAEDALSVTGVKLGKK